MRNKNLLNLVLLSLACTFIFSSCVSKKKFDQLFNDKESLDKMLTEQRQKVESLEGDVASLNEAKTKLEADNSSLNSKVADMQSKMTSTQSALDAAKKGASENEAKVSRLSAAIKGAFAAYKKAGLEVTEHGDRLVVNMPEPILFKSGSTRLRSKYKENVANLAAVLKDNPDLKVMVEGHTDSKKMINGAPFTDNLSLSAARAMGVVRELVKHGASQNQVSAVGRGDAIPANPEGTAEAMQENRRVEIVIMPGNVPELHQLSNAGV